MEGVGPKRFFPAFLDLDTRLVVIIGTGKPAEKRARQFARYGADVIVITPRPSEALLETQAEGLLTVEQRPYVRGDLSGAFLVICAHDDEEVRRAVYEEAEAVGCLLNVTGAPQYSNFLISSVVRHGRLELAISTGGAAPQAAKALRKHLDASVGDEWSRWIDMIADCRALAATRLAERPEDAAALLAAATDEGIRERLAAGETITADSLFEDVVGSEEPVQADDAGEED